MLNNNFALFFVVWLCTFEFILFDCDIVSLHLFVLKGFHVLGRIHVFCAVLSVIQMLGARVTISGAMKQQVEREKSREKESNGQRTKRGRSKSNSSDQGKCSPKSCKLKNQFGISPNWSPNLYVVFVQFYQPESDCQNCCF